MSGVEEETVAAFPRRGIRIEGHVLAVEDVDKVSSAHGTTGVSGLCFFHHAARQDTNVVGSRIEGLDRGFHYAGS